MTDIPDSTAPHFSVSVVIPVYNSAATIPVLVAEVLKVLEIMRGRHELILVNDGSRDRSWDAIAHAAEAHDCVRGIDLRRNYGQHNALLCGIREARFDVVITLDDDLQHPPEEIPRLLAELEEGHDLVYGVPRRGQHGRWRSLASWATRQTLHRGIGAESAGNVSAFRAFRTPLREAFATYEGPFVSLDVLMSWATSLVGYIRVHHRPRQVGTSHYGLFGLLTHAGNLVTGMSVVPLHFATLIGLIFSLVGLVVLLFVVVRFLVEGSAVAGFPFLASIIAVFAGAQLFSLGIIGAYIARVHFHVMQRPAYTVRRRTPAPKRL